MSAGFLFCESRFGLLLMSFLQQLKKLFARKPKVHRIDITKRFELVVPFGQGTMSKVWRALDRTSGREVAVKVLDKVRTRRFEARFQGLNKPSEGHIAVQLNHPNVVKTYEFGTTLNDEQFLVMELIDGVSLTWLVEMQNEQMQQQRLSLIVQLGEAIEYVHSAGWIHRDLCPRNILVDKSGVLKLIDFGLMVPNTPPFRAPGNRTGTANYMAPELIKRQPTDQRIDIFSYSVTCFEMFTKQLPWEAAESLEAVMQHINKPPRDIRELHPGIDETVAATIMKGLERDPRDRWQTMTEMLQPLRQTLKSQESGAARRRRRRAAGNEGS